MKCNISEAYFYHELLEKGISESSVLCIETNGGKWYKYTEFPNNIPAKRVFSYWPTFKITFADNSELNEIGIKTKNNYGSTSSDDLTQEKIHRLRYNQALKIGHIESNLQINEFIENFDRRIYPKLPDKGKPIIIYDNCIDKGKRLECCVEELLKAGYPLNNLYFSQNGEIIRKINLYEQQTPDLK